MPPITRHTAKAQLKQRTNKKIANDSTDILISLDYSLFLKDLVYEASLLAKRDGSMEVLPSHIKQVKEKLLKKYRG